ncbi:MAG: hypothetical protein ACYDB2_09365 [Acidimicrobiales bacterium]
MNVVTYYRSIQYVNRQIFSPAPVTLPRWSTLQESALSESGFPRQQRTTVAE